jgi:16S rRNA (guanine527-N7)-methyltransferase
MDYLLAWNDKINLVSRASTENMASHHIVDSVLAATMIPEVNSVTDLGTGGGLPGMIMAILFPATHVTLADTKAKKINFLNNCFRDLNLPNVKVHDAASLAPERTSDLLVCRAFASLDKILREGKKYLRPGGQIYAFKGRMATVEQELSAIARRYRPVVRQYSLITPEETHERTLVILKT